jgi:hypothetical protein
MHAHIYIMHKRRLKWNSHVSPLDLSREKHGMVWVEIKVMQENMMNTTKCQRELEWALAWGRKHGTIAIIAKQHLINIVYPLTYLTWIVKWRNPNRHDDGRIQVQQMAGRIVFGMTLNCASVNSLQLQHYEGLIALILKIVRMEEVSRVSLRCRWIYTKSPTSNCLTLGL